jgi:predicted AAA+ superfamily ATPase
MANFELPDHLIETLSLVLKQLHQTLPEVHQEPDFDAPAKWHHHQLKPIYQPKQMYLEDLLGIDTQKQKIIQNTLQFLEGLPANDILLTGSRGTGNPRLSERY